MPNIAPAGQDGTEAVADTPLLRLDAAVRAFAARGAARFQAIRLIIILMLDALIILGSFMLSRLILSDLPMPRTLFDPWFMALFVGVNLTMLFVIRTYRQSWRFLSVGDALSLAASLLASSWLIWMITAGLIAPQKMMRGVMTIFLTVDVPLTVVLLLAARASRRAFYKHVRSARLRRTVQARRRILLLGELDWARVMADLVPTDGGSGLEIVGLISFDGHERRLNVGGLPILGSPEMLPRIVADLDRLGKRPVSLVVQESSERLDRQQILRIANLAEQENLVVSRFRNPWTSAQSMDGDRLAIEKMPLAELLGRPEITVQHSYLERVVTGARIMVTGAGGTIGGELVRQLAYYSPVEIVLLDHSEYNLYAIEMEAREKFPHVRFHAELCSIRQRPALWQVFERRRPEIVFHAAALKHVPMVEANPCAGVHTNVLGTRNVADAVCEFEARAMIQVSTDKAVNPVGLMGATKRLGELYCQALDLIGSCDPDSPRFLTVRFGNVLGSSGSLIPLFQQQLANGKPLTVTHPDIERFFMTVQEAVLLILQSSARALETDSERGTIFVLDMGEPVKIVEIARRVIRMAGLRPDIDVPIKFIGLRPGEKLFEELFDTSEDKIESAIPGIFEAMPSPIPLEMLVEGFGQLARLIAAGDADELVRLTHEMVAASASSRWAEILRRLAAESADTLFMTPRPAEGPVALPTDLPRDVA
ncbi:polysaccharide biosynthesis protein [Sphingobium chlorophenolicum]|uniref:Polysaccharide biosynthesis protein CapD n=1 Tax=Sphingobium chlorophenolicum TaxID=46429 RepID=A0A081RG03_SPHCR|nr:polysaccharide biosynthesis protein [Sphingobium chlorophenolicum]KEQ54126.1 Polysaccharide biosynthesis protein CapD [Sphingobium chlorophenolicum]